MKSSIVIKTQPQVILREIQESEQTDKKSEDIKCFKKTHGEVANMPNVIKEYKLWSLRWPNMSEVHFQTKLPGCTCCLKTEQEISTKIWSKAISLGKQTPLLLLRVGTTQNSVVQIYCPKLHVENVLLLYSYTCNETCVIMFWCRYIKLEFGYSIFNECSIHQCTLSEKRPCYTK